MNWEAIGAVAELFGATGVILSLIYVAVQIRHSREMVKQNTSAVELESTRAITEEVRNMFDLITSNRDLAEIVSRAAGGSHLEAADRMRYYTFFNNLYRSYENAYLFRQRGVLESGHWHGITHMMSDCTKMSMFKVYWADRRHWYSPEFQQHMESEVIPKAVPEGVNVPGKYTSDPEYLPQNRV